MVTRLKAKDRPEPWFSSKKQQRTTSEENPIPAEGTGVHDSAANKAPQESSKRGRGRPKGKTKVVDPKKKKATRKSMTPSAMDVVLGCSKTRVPYANELCEKRKADALACGQHLRTVVEAPKVRSIAVKRTANSTDGDRNRDVASPKVASAFHSSTPMSPPTVEGTDKKNKVEDADVLFVKEPNDRGQPSLVRRPRKEPITDDLYESERFQRSLDNRSHSNQPHRNIKSDVNSGGRRVGDPTRRVSSLPPTEFYSSSYQGRVTSEKDSPEVAHRGQRRRSGHFHSESPSENINCSRYDEEYQSPPRRLSRSPRHWTEGRCRENIQKFAQQYKEYAYARGYDDEYQNSTRFSSGDQPLGRYESMSPQKGMRHGSSRAPKDGPGLRRSVTPNDSQSAQRRSMNGRNTGGMQWTSSSHLNGGQNMETVPAVDRKDRRHNQSTREAEMITRQSFGKKAFYLTLDREGKPYGPGKPAWIAEINKLAIALDPSCTNVRKQTYEDVQIFKDCLNENFESSGMLNQDNLRGEMDKAITKRRAELISVIKRNGKRPLTIDEEIWKRLEKLASSRQWQEKSEQGRRANASQKTLGRTDLRGMNGVREKLRLLLGRSPDPDEVEEEMQRDKGYGGKRRKMSKIAVKVEKRSKEHMLSDDDSPSEASARNSDGFSSDTVSSRHIKRCGRDAPEMEAEGGDYDLLDVDVYSRSAITADMRNPVARTENISKDAYIEKLKATIQQLQAEKAEGTTSTSFGPSQSAMSLPSSTKKGLLRRSFDT